MKINNRYLIIIISIMMGAIVFNIDRIVNSLGFSLSSQNLVKQTESQNSINSQDSKSNKFFVLAGESFYPDSLANEPNRVKARIGAEKFNELFKDVKICRSFSDTKKYYLVLGSNLPEEEANKLKQQAIDNYFRPDTYSLQENLIDFNPSDCKKNP
ncbi:hypothetical protein FJR38_25685 [Anabaena sp. UHCC 0253]|uniref:hypothetical protein n=1 Tax=Anabaena sp. UHCC 0253 TaxID=2590019 RepID=UPI001444A5BD|nr:hypothetical protein [Anabaena sp. UHCC 0253]MTJ55812.1 hypothetical protein [Anabaena sp. UHCC 0253]